MRQRLEAYMCRCWETTAMGWLPGAEIYANIYAG